MSKKQYQYALIGVLIITALTIVYLLTLRGNQIRKLELAGSYMGGINEDQNED